MNPGVIMFAVWVLLTIIGSVVCARGYMQSGQFILGSATGVAVTMSIVTWLGWSR